jgi:hypothetical protein
VAWLPHLPGSARKKQSRSVVTRTEDSATAMPDLWGVRCEVKYLLVRYLGEKYKENDEGEKCKTLHNKIKQVGQVPSPARATFATAFKIWYGVNQAR